MKRASTYGGNIDKPKSNKNQSSNMGSAQKTVKRKTIINQLIQ